MITDREKEFGCKKIESFWREKKKKTSKSLKKFDFFFRKYFSISFIFYFCLTVSRSTRIVGCRNSKSRSKFRSRPDLLFNEASNFLSVLLKKNRSEVFPFRSANPSCWGQPTPSHFLGHQSARPADSQSGLRKEKIERNQVSSSSLQLTAERVSLTKLFGKNLFLKSPLFGDREAIASWIERSGQAEPSKVQWSFSLHLGTRLFWWKCRVFATFYLPR